MKNTPQLSALGFTLLEVLLAIAILTGVIITVSQTWSGNFNRVRKITLSNNVATLLERKMTEIEAKFQKAPVSEIPEEEEGDFGADLPNYSWKLKSQKFQMPDLSALLTSKDDGANEMLITMIKQLSEYVSKAVKEVTVSVLLKSGGKTTTYDATTYFVDWEQEIAMPGGGGGTPNGGAPGGDPSDPQSNESEKTK